MQAVTDLDETLGALTDLVHQGKVRYSGSSRRAAHRCPARHGHPHVQPTGRLLAVKAALDGYEAVEVAHVELDARSRRVQAPRAATGAAWTSPLARRSSSSSTPPASTTKVKQRDKHLRSEDFFDVVNHPQVRFDADAATLDGDTLTARGRLHAAGRHIPLDVDATVTPAGDGFELEASALADHRELGMLWSPMGIMRAPSRLVVRGRLVRAEDQR